jgi:hypothetical protein
MRCYCCNKALSDYEATRKSVSTGQFLDMCNKCYGSISSEVLAIERTDLRHEDDEELDFYLEDIDNLTSWNERSLDE